MFSGIHHEMTLYVQYTNNQAVKKWLPLELRCAVYLEYIVTIHFVCPYPSVLTLYVQYTKTLALKKWLPFEIICAVYLEYIVTIHFVHSYPNLVTLYVQYTKTLAVKKWLPFELICAVYFEYIVTIHFVCPYPSLPQIYWPYMFSGIHFEITLHVQYTKNQAVHECFSQIPRSNPVNIMNRPYMFSTPRTKPSKSGFHLSL